MWHPQPLVPRANHVVGSGPVSLSLCMIVRDNEGTLPACLAGIRPWVDEIVIVDTGSRDTTPAIAQSFGARVFHFPWCDDFSAARNESLRHAQGEWLFWMDSDDTNDADNGRKIRDIANQNHDPSLLGFVMQVHCPGPGTQCSDDVTAVDHVKMVRNHPELRFDFRIHEQLLPSIRRLGGNIAWTDAFVVHSGSDHSPAGRERKFVRDLRILALDLQERPEHPFVLFNLGMTHEDMGSYAEAVRYLRSCLDVSHPGESHVRKAYALLICAYTKLGEHLHAWQACEEGRKLFPDDAELAFRQGMLAYEMGRLEDSKECYLVALRGESVRHFSSMDRGVCSFKARHNLALVYRELGRPDLAEIQCRQAVWESPKYHPTRRLLIDMLLAQHKLSTAELAIEQAGEIGDCEADASIFRANVAELRGDHRLAQSLLEVARRQFPDSNTVLERLCRFYFLDADSRQAESSLLELAQRVPQDAAVRTNLAAVYLSRGKHQAAEEWLRESVRLRPQSASTWALLGKVLATTGKADEALAAYREASRFSPLDPDAQRAVLALEGSAVSS